MKYRIIYNYYYFVQKLENEIWTTIVSMESLSNAEKYVDLHLNPNRKFKVIKEYEF